MRSHAFPLTLVVVISVVATVGCGSGERRAITELAKVPITASSEDAVSAYLEGRALQERFRAADARPHFERAVAADPQFALAHLGVAATSPTTQEFFAAASKAEECAASASEGERLQIEAFMAGVNGEPERQLALLEQLETMYPGDERVLQQLGAYHFFTHQDYSRALGYFERAIEIDPAFSPAYNLLGYTNRFLGDFEGAETAFKHYTELIDDEPNPYDSYAELLMRMGRFDESIASYRKALAIEPTFVNAYVGIANDLMFQGESAQARAVLDELRGVAANDGQRRLACTWAAVSYMHEGDWDGALAEVKRREAIAAEISDNGAISADRNFAGNILLVAGRLGEAEQAFRDCAEMAEASDATEEVKEATRRNALYDLARVAVASGDLARARELAAEYRRQVAVHQIPAEVWQASELDGRIAAAEGDWYGVTKAFAEGNQQDPRVVFALAQALEAAGQRDSAVETCRTVANYNQLNVNYGYVRTAALEMCGAQ